MQKIQDIKRYLIFVVILFSIIGTSLCYLCSCANQEKQIGDITECKVTKIVDGDTFYVNKYKERIRIIGVDCPESNTQDGKNATDYTKSQIKVGQTVWLEKDTSDVDKYNRPLRIVWLEKPNNIVNKTDVNTKTLEGKLLSSGHAKILTIKPDVKYSDWWS